jgi:uncharacterized protein (DUF362 family)
MLPGCSFKSLTSQPGGTPKATIDNTQLSPNELIVANGKDPATLLANGFKAFGGIERLIKPGSTVVLKPNISVPREPDEAATTNPILVGALVKMCLNAGAKEVKVIEFPFTNAAICSEKSGMKKAVTEAGGKFFILNNDRGRFQAVKINGQALQEVEFSKDAMEADVLINMPILKHHNMTKLTMGLKNMMGLIWNRGQLHATDLHRAIAELTAFKKPTFIIMDAMRGITANGPMGPGPIKECNQLVFGADPVAVDAYGATLFGAKPSEINHLRIAAEMGLGQIDWEKLNVKRV